MRRIIFLKLCSLFGGALSVWMELHIFYTMFELFDVCIRGDAITKLDTILLPIDIWLFFLGLLLHYMIEERWVQFAEQGQAEFSRRGRTCS